MSEDPIKQIYYEIGKLLSPYTDINRFILDKLTGLFHSQEMNEEVEGERKCPFDAYDTDTEFESHTELASHIMEYHGDKLFRYIEAFDHTLNHPSESHISDLFNEEIVGSDHPEMICAYCNYDAINKMEYMRHYREIDKNELEAIVKLLKTIYNENRTFGSLRTEDTNE